jgi:hypothetical protein
MQEPAATFPGFPASASPYLLVKQKLFAVCTIFINKAWTHSLVLVTDLRGLPHERDGGA